MKVFTIIAVVALTSSIQAFACGPNDPADRNVFKAKMSAEIAQLTDTRQVSRAKPAGSGTQGIVEAPKKRF